LDAVHGRTRPLARLTPRDPLKRRPPFVDSYSLACKRYRVVEIGIVHFHPDGGGMDRAPPWNARKSGRPSEPGQQVDRDRAEQPDNEKRDEPLQIGAWQAGRREADQRQGNSSEKPQDGDGFRIGKRCDSVEYANEVRSSVPAICSIASVSLPELSSQRRSLRQKFRLATSAIMLRTRVRVIEYSHTLAGE